MADKKFKYVYYGRRPTNVCWNGVSFPLMPGEIIVCTPAFIAAFIDKKFYKEVPPGSAKDREAVRHTLGPSPTFLRRDPTGGLPMKSVVGPRKTKISAIDKSSPALREDNLPKDNPYDMGEDKNPVIDIGTSMSTPTAPEPLSVSVTTVPPSEVGKKSEEESVLDQIDADLEVEEEVEGEAPELEANDIEIEDPKQEEVIPEDKSEVDAPPPDFPTRTQLRGLKVPELKETCGRFGVPLPEKPTRGPLLEALWAAFKYDEE